MRKLGWYVVLIGLGIWCVFAAPLPSRLPGDQLLFCYFSNEVEMVADLTKEKISQLLENPDSSKKLRQQLIEMLGLPLDLERTPLHACVTGTNFCKGVLVEKVHFQPIPRVYYTANLYLPLEQQGRLPAILYLCGHWSFVSNGISYGNKVRYQRDGITFAKNGYACLVLDTVQWGEIPTDHRGTSRQAAWWWNSIGFSPAGIETWAAIRALDYLCTRSEINTNCIGVTGHSGGGAYAWMLAAVDDRVKAVAPMAGIADLETHVIDGLIDSHCDCNFPINLYRWDFTLIPALVAPKPLLIGGTDADRIFPLETTLRIYRQTKFLYRNFGAETNLSLVITPGPHDETLDMRMAVILWFERHLKGEYRSTPVLQQQDIFTPEQLKVFSTIPADALNYNVAGEFSAFHKRQPPQTLAELQEVLLKNVFGGWPKICPMKFCKFRTWTNAQAGLELFELESESQPFVPLYLYLLQPSTVSRPGKVQLYVLTHEEWCRLIQQLRRCFPEFGVEAAQLPEPKSLMDNFVDSNQVVAFVAVRGVGPGKWTDDEQVLTRVRRRFMALGQTLDGMRVWDIRSAIRILEVVKPELSREVHLCGSGVMGVNALYAAVFEPTVSTVILQDPPASHREGPDYLNVLRFVDIRDTIRIMRASGKIVEIRSTQK